MSALNLSSSYSIPAIDEVVEDSEPEREEARRRRKEERRRGMKSRTPEKSVIVVTDHETSSPIHTITGPIIVTSGCIESASSSPEIVSPPVYISSAESASGKSSSLSELHLKDIVRDTSSKGQALVDTGSLTASESDVELEETTSRMRTELNRFAFPNLPRTQSNQTRSRSSSVLSHHFPIQPTGEAKVANKTMRTKDSSPTLVDISEKQLVPLRKCVGCNVAWTTRKTVVQKVTHIKRCAKKAKITDEALKALILKELESTPPEELAKSKGKRKKMQQIEDAKPKTFLEEVVDEAQAQRVKKRKAIDSSTVKTVSETREAILDKARQFLQPPADSGSSGSLMPPPLTQAFGQSKFASGPSRIGLDNSDQGPKRTQAFGRSSLAERFSGNSHATSLFSAAEPPTTQAFATSRLGLALQVSGRSSCWSESDTNSMVRYSDNPPVDPATSYTFRDVDLLENLGEQDGDDVPGRNAASDYGDNENVCGKDDAILVFEPNQSDTGGLGVHPDKSRILDILDGRPIALDTTDTICITQTIPKSKSKSKSKATPKRKKKVAEAEGSARKIEIDEEELSSRLTALILADEQLYMRILRYEPLHIDVFLDFVRDVNISALSLKSKVRSFLDKQAIHYYEIEAGQRGRRRR